MNKKCDTCNKGIITFGRWRSAIDGDGEKSSYRVVQCSNKNCIINGLFLDSMLAIIGKENQT